MENASKALIMAGGMLIAMLIVGLLVWGYNNISDYQRTNAETEELEDIREFNLKLEAYNRGSVRGYQMISLANLARDYNSKYSEDDGYYPVEIIAGIQEGGHLPRDTENPDVITDYSMQNYVKADGSSVTIGKVYDMVKYVETIYEGESLNSNERNEFKQLYFECTAVIYDNEKDPRTGETGHGLGRVKRMEFVQVKVDTTR